MKIQLSDHFDYKKLMRFTLPSIVMMIFTSIYSVVDGFFVSTVVGKTPFAAVNFVMPILMILGAVGFMLGTGGSALIARIMGEGDNERANRLFSLLVLVGAVLGVVIGIVGFVTVRPLCALFGAEGEMLENCVLYGRIILLGLPFYMLQFEFQSFFVTAEKPHVGLAATVASGVTNMVLDALFVAAFSWGLVGAAVATVISQMVGAVIALVYFARPNSSRLRFTRPRMDGRALLRTCTNGSSELMSNISMSVVGMLYNIQLMKYAGEDGVAAYGVLMYINMIFLAVFIGYAVGVAPVVSYHFGAQNTDELKSLFRRSFLIIGCASVCMFAAGEALSYPLSALFVGYDEALLNMTVHAFRIYSFSFLLCGISIFGSSFFTALNDGLTSALISFLRTLLFQTVAVMVMPLIWELDGIWYSITAAEVMSVIVTAAFLFAYRKKYHYF